MKLYFAVENPSGISAKALAAILDKTLSGLPASEIATVNCDIVEQIFRQNISMGKGMGLMSMVQAVQALAKAAERTYWPANYWLAGVFISSPRYNSRNRKLALSYRVRIRLRRRLRQKPAKTASPMRDEGPAKTSTRTSRSPISRSWRPMNSKGARRDPRAKSSRSEYLTDQFKAAGLEPGNPDGTWTQAVPLSSASRPLDLSPLMDFAVKGGKTQSFKIHDDYVLWSRRVQDQISLDKSPIVFAGTACRRPRWAGMISKAWT